ncbi:UvrD-helicase domain-containing protein [Apibacter raozihei]|uniref:UvrD-helicase domain-containing protein n=1 Tax=Apibacter raozihei TaxID=2500547 RepID=UPI000FE3C274|nr:UvrD-helicase domain-containing protein [Apibacter raozihei]
MGSSYTIYNASAGAGKTYTLVKNFLTILLKNENPESVRSILAVTFTNKAANEMKNRILSWLKAFSESESSTEHPVLKEISLELGLNLKEVKLRAKKALSYILHHYSLLSISTIDKFNLRLMKSFTKELGLSYSFAVELDSSDYLKQSIDELIDQLGTDNPFAEVILNYVFWKFENESSTEIRKELLVSSQNFLKEMHLDKITSVSEKDFDDFRKLTQLLINRIKDNNEDIQFLAKRAIHLIENNHLEVYDFYQGARGMAGFFYKLTVPENSINNYHSIKTNSTYYIDFCENEKYAKSKSLRENDIREIAPELISIFSDIKKKINRIKIDESVRRNLITIELQSEIGRFLNGKKEEQDILFLSDVNPIISKHLKDEPVAFIYEKLGGRYNHYFIDEFQDTSQLQWNNLTPLIDNARVSNGTSITLVGDPKQAIYRFRSGKPEILMNLISSSEQQNITVITLGNNYRSLPNIVDFNNKFYKFLAETELDSKEYRVLFGDNSYQVPKQEKGGRVQVSFVKPSDEEGNYLASTVLDIIKEAIENGFSYKDIAVLVRNKKHSYPIVELLAENDIPILTEEALLVASSPAVKSIIAAFRWLNQVHDKEQLVIMLYYLWKLDKIIIKDYTAEMLIIKNLNFDESIVYLQNQLGINVRYQQNNSLSFFDFAEELIQSLGFGSKENMYLSALLDLILQMEKSGAISLKEFLESWELKSPGLSIRFPENMNAVQIMTIHKSKGLEFPVVINPIMDRRNMNEEYWFPLDKSLYNGFEQYYTSTKSGLEEVDENIKEVVDYQSFEKSIDDLCVQYVATTRASQQLFLIQEKKEKSKETLIEKFLSANSYNISEKSIELYDQDNYGSKGSENEKNISNEEKINWNSNRWNKKIRVSTEMHKYYSEENKDIQYGNSIHTILEQVNTYDDLQKVIKKMVLNGIIQKKEESSVTSILQAVVTHPQLVKYFQQGTEIFSEQEILFEGKFYRPDRLVKINDQFTIIDFKTGDELSKHSKQIEGYSKALEASGYVVAEKLVIYINNSGIKIKYI